MALNPRITDWQGRRVWLVGASSGIGRATASLLHARGAQVVVSARNAAALQAFTAQHPGSQAVALDVTDRAAVQAASTGRPGHLSLVASVAGLRGLPQGLAYGPTKAALIHLAETLYLDLHDQGIGVSVINPGFVDTPLTAANEFPMPALASPAQAASAIVRGWERGAFEIHFPRRFTHVMKLLRLLPYRLYFAAVRRMTGL